jgi:hypothetical protein
MCVGEGYFFFFLPVFFFFAFLAFLAMLPSVIPKLFNASRTRHAKTEYTTIAKLILRASKKVNGGHAVARCGWANLSHDASRR